MEDSTKAGGLIIVNKPLAITPDNVATASVIKHTDWLILKARVETSLDKKNTFIDSFSWNNMGTLFLGITLATGIGFWLPGFAPNMKIIAWIVIIFTLLLGVICTYFQYQSDMLKNSENNAASKHIIELMEVIGPNIKN